VLHLDGREVDVYRPGVADSADLPVVYFLHGSPGSAGDVFGAGLAAALDAWVAGGGRPFVVASPDGNGSRPDTEWADAADGADRLESFVVGVVVPSVEGDHPRDRGHRAVAGFSMGGYGAMNLGLRHPDVFGQVVSLAGYFHAYDGEGVFGGDSGEEAANSPDQHVESARNTRIALLDGDHDQVPIVKGESQRFASLLRDAGMDPEVVISSGGHDWDYVSSQFRTVIEFLDAGWS
jgi:S-formylglutathione hydrolase FrmB